MSDKTEQKTAEEYLKKLFFAYPHSLQNKTESPTKRQQYANNHNTREMKATELRIGNYVYQSDAYGDTPITGYQIYQFDTFCRGGIVADYYKGFKPIPLTEEWLLRFGFEKDDTIWIKHPIYGLLEKNGRFFIELGETGGIYIQYVHQLQNLYFALTGEELTPPSSHKEG